MIWDNTTYHGAIWRRVMHSCRGSGCERLAACEQCYLSFVSWKCLGQWCSLQRTVKNFLTTMPHVCLFVFQAEGLVCELFNVSIWSKLSFHQQSLKKSCSWNFTLKYPLDHNLSWSRGQMAIFVHRFPLQISRASQGCINPWRMQPLSENWTEPSSKCLVKG